LPESAGAALAGGLAIMTVASGLSVLYHGLSLAMDSKGATKQLRERIISQQLGEQLLQQGLAQQSDTKAKRLSVPDDQAVTISDDGELVPLEEYEQQQARRDKRGR
jgi:hypothetical protein